MVIETSSNLNLPNSVNKITKKYESFIIEMNDNEFKEFLKINGFTTNSEENEQLIGITKFILKNQNYVAQYWDNMNERKTYLNNNKDVW